MMRIEVLRLGHRPQRDPRVTTHVALTARAFGAAAIRVAEPDAGLERTLRSVTKRFGGDFTVATGTGWKGPIREWQASGGQVVHLSMYGRPLGEALPEIRGAAKAALVVVGAEKVPGDLYAMADHNVAVGSQPHSEVAALAVFLDRLTGGAWQSAAFPGAALRVVPTARGKRVADGSA